MNTLYRSIILLLLLLNSCKNNPDTVEIPDHASADPELIFVSLEQFKHSGMELGSLSEYTFDKAIQATGIVDVPPQYKASVTAKMGGFIKETALLEGDRVKKGQFLVSVENPEFIQMQQSYLEIRERLAYLENEYERQKTLFEEKIISEKSYLQAESQYKSAMASCTGLKKQLQILNISTSNVESGVFTSVARIYAPIDGNISRINISKGSPVSPDSVILEIIDNSHIHIELSVFEKDVLKVKKGQAIRFQVPESYSEWQDGEVHLVGSALEENRTVTVHAHPSDEQLTLLPGMFISAEIIFELVELPAFPNTGIIEVEGRHNILKLESQDKTGYMFRQIPVTVTHTSDIYSSFRESMDFSSEDLFLEIGGYNLIGE
ncbi:MAG: efflux RND transporter periplasmic adaptor subunit [Flavobacteriaceae bacterium]|nr:efflux RND transporter periplasmic adaptor subunit [Flavobacteriaceae bacterium]